MTLMQYIKTDVKYNKNNRGENKSPVELKNQRVKMGLKTRLKRFYRGSHFKMRF